MTPFDRVVIVDWSGGNDRGPRPKKDAIWSAVHSPDGPEAPVYHRNRAVAESWLTRQIDEATAGGQRLFLGFDFPFGYPEGFAAALTGRPDPLAVWDHYSAHLHDSPKGNNRFALAGAINARFPGRGPFWFNGTGQDIADLPHSGRDRHGHGLPERRRCETLAKGSFSCWQLGGAGSVGSQAITGMAVLARIRQRFAGRVAVWPFEDTQTAPIVLAEVWPSLHADKVRDQMTADSIKDAVQVQVLANLIWQMQSDGRLAPAMQDIPNDCRIEEGWILGL